MTYNKQKLIEEQKGKPLPDVLLEMYPKCGSQKALAEQLNVTQPTISLWFTRYRLTEKKILVREEEIGVAS